MNLQTHVRGRTRLLLALILFLGVMTIIDDYRGWRFLLLALGSVWWLSWLWARSLARSLHLRREMRFGWAQVGDQLEERFTLTNQGTFPGPCIEIVDHSNMPGYQNNLVTGIDNHDTTQWRTKGVCSRRDR